MNDIKKLREMTGAGLADCKKALAESDDMDGAVAYLRKKGQAVAAKRSDREAAEGCVLVKAENGFAAIIALKCETDFVANNADFVALTQSILDAAVAAKCKTLDEVKALPMGEGTIADAVTARSGITGEKMELDGYCRREDGTRRLLHHRGREHRYLQPHEPQRTLHHAQPEQEGRGRDRRQEHRHADCKCCSSGYREKSKAEQVQKAVEAAIKKAGFNPAHFDSEDHMESNQAKGWITAEDVAKVKEIIATVSAEKAANLNPAMIENIAKGRVNKFLKENCLMSQEYIWDKNLTVASYLQSIDKDLTVTDFKRFTLRAE